MLISKDLIPVKLKRWCHIEDGHSTKFYEKWTEFYLTPYEYDKFKKKNYI